MDRRGGILGGRQSQGLEEVDLREFECLGACDMAPMASFDGRYVGPMLVEDAPEVVSALREEPLLSRILTRLQEQKQRRA